MSVFIKPLILAFSIATVAFVSKQAIAEEKTNITDKRQAQLVHMVKQDCGSCHGMTLKGGLGPALTKDALKGKPLLLLQNTIIHGRPGTAMPPWKNILTEQEAKWISQQLLQGIENDK